MLILGIILLVIGFLLGFQILWIIGAVLAVVGALALVSGAGFHRPIGGRTWWY